MKFWIATCVIKETGEIETCTYASDERHEKSKVKKDILETNPQYSKVSLKKGKRPKGWVLFEGVR